MCILFLGRNFMMKRLLLSLLQLCIWLPAWPQEVDLEEARQKATSFFHSAIREKERLKSGETVMMEVTRVFYAGQEAGQTPEVYSGGPPVFYLFTPEGREGFVMVSADQRVPEILAWSGTGVFCETPPQLKNLLNRYVKEISLIREFEILPEGRLKVASAVQEPLLGNIAWGQSPDPYNTLCPVDPHTGRRCMAGCVATALAQVIYYYKYPRVGTGSHGYPSAYGYLSADFSKADYRYWLMDEKPVHGVANPDIAELTYHCGIVLDMEYGPYGSAAFAGMIPGALEKYFKYKKAEFLFRSQFSQENWEDKLKNEVAQKRPVIYSALDPKDPEDPEDPSSGHAFVIDGYDNEGRFHVNWGWEGCSNGYYALELLNPDDCGDIYHFSETHSAVAGIEPLSSFECLFSLSVDSLSFDAAGGSSKVGLYANSDWKVESGDSWIVVTPGSGNDTTEVVVQALPYNGFLGRHGTVTLISCNVTRKIAVFQEGTCKIALPVNEISFPDTASSGKLEVKSTASWIVTGKPSWAQVVPSYGNGNETLTVSVPAFTGYGERTGTLTVSGCNEQKLAAISQKGSCQFSLSREVIYKDHEAGEDSVTVSSNSLWHAETSDSWISVIPSSATGNGKLTIKVNANNGLTERTGTVTLRVCDISRTITLRQKGNCNLTANPSTLEFQPEAATLSVTVSSNSTWSAFSPDYWITVTPSSGKDEGILKISVTTNRSTSNRSGQISLIGCNTVQKIDVLQKSHSTLDLSAEILDFTYMPGSMSVSLTATNYWIATSDVDWLTVKPRYGYQSKNLEVSVDLNKGDSPRQAHLSFSDGNLTRIVTVRQEACQFTLSDDRLTFGAGEGNQPVTIGSRSFWSAWVAAPWIHLSSMSGTEGGTVTVTVEPNEGGRRSDWINFSGCFATKRLEIIQEGVATALHSAQKGLCRVYPLPAGRFVTVEWPGGVQESCFVEFYNETGCLIFQKEVWGSRGQFDLQRCSPGIYFMRISARCFTEVVRVVVR